MSDPLQRGLSAGHAAYNDATPKKRLGVSADDLRGLRSTVQSGLSDAAAQRQVLDTNAAKQAAGYYPSSGTSAAAYNYLRGQGGYPVNAVPSGLPVNTGVSGYGGVALPPGGTSALPSRAIARPPIGVYEDPSQTPKTQTELALKAKTDPTKMGKVTQQTVNMPKPGLVNQLLATAAPVYLGYTLLDKFGGTKALSEGWDKLFPSSSGLPAGYDASSTQALIDQYYTNPSVEVASATDDALQVLAERQAAEKAATDAAIAEGVGAGAGAGAGAGTGAGVSSEAAAWDAATAGEYGGQEAAASMGEGELATLFAEYGPYVAAAIIADRMTGGKISGAVGDVIQSAGEVGEDIIGGVGEAGQGIIDAGKDIFSGIGDIFGWAEGGPVAHARGGLSELAMAHGGASHLGGYSDGGRLLRGPGDGVSDSIPATIGNKQPARLADGEFVVPARIVSELGNGSTEAGARKLYAMMDRVQKARGKTVGKGKVAKNTRADKYLPG